MCRDKPTVKVSTNNYYMWIVVQKQYIKKKKKTHINEPYQINPLKFTQTESSYTVF